MTSGRPATASPIMSVNGHACWLGGDPPWADRGASKDSLDGIRRSLRSRWRSAPSRATRSACARPRGASSTGKPIARPAGGRVVQATIGVGPTHPPFQTRPASMAERDRHVLLPVPPLTKATLSVLEGKTHRGQGRERVAQVAQARLEHVVHLPSPWYCRTRGGSAARYSQVLRSVRRCPGHALTSDRRQ